MKKNGKINTKQLILLIIVVLFVGYELLFAGGNENETDLPQESPVQSLVLESSQTVEESGELLYSEESVSPMETELPAAGDTSEVPSVSEYLSFRNDKLWESHYEKHGIDMGFASMEEYLEAANLVLYNEDTLHKIEAEDGDDVYFLEETGEFVVVSTDGYIRTYFIPDAGIDYFNRQ